MITKRKHTMYDREFKIQAVKLLEEGRSTMSQIAKDLGVNINTLSNWRKKYLTNAEKAFEGTPELSEEQKRIRELERRLKDQELENQILKKAVAIFSVVKK